MKKTVMFAAIAALGLTVSVQAADLDAGKKVYDTACFACHTTGAAGAPKLGDKAAWKARIAQGNSTLEIHALKGYQGKKGFMPAKGGRADLGDDAVKDAIAYMVAQSK